MKTAYEHFDNQERHLFREVRPGQVTIIDESKNITSNLSFYEKHRKDLKHTTGSL